MPSISDVENLWKNCSRFVVYIFLTYFFFCILYFTFSNPFFEIRSLSPDDEALVNSESHPFLTSLRNVGSSVFHYPSEENRNFPFSMNRKNYLTLVSEFSFLALDSALRKDDGTVN